MEDVRHEMDENPLISLTKIDIEERWRVFSSELALDVREAADRPLPRVCVSEQGVAHSIVN